MLDVLEKNIGDIVIESIDAGAIKARQLLLERVFEEHETVDGTPFGKYKSKSYRAYRRSVGRQVAEKDLELTGNLLRSIVQRENEVIFNDAKSEQKARYQETSPKQINKPIFDLSDEEVRDCIRVIDEVFTKQIERLVDGVTITV